MLGLGVRKQGILRSEGPGNTKYDTVSVFFQTTMMV